MIHRHIALAALGALHIASGSAAHAQPIAAPQYGIKADAPIGSNIARHGFTSNGIPINRRYDELSPREKALVASWYERIDPGDEPPFPAEGLKQIGDAVRQAHRKYPVRGELLLYASVGPSGDVDSVKVFKSPDPDLTQLLSTVLMLTKFKPAVCGGRPCRMDYPLAVNFQLEY